MVENLGDMGSSILHQALKLIMHCNNPKVMNKRQEKTKLILFWKQDKSLTINDIWSKVKL